uniref:ARID domain-containing protein n=1 Tax=Spongospora subterranea TaxID=70186 RepID=A0A0H5R7D9_9EUKA|eukprot:CRZ09731.1 hypothetical protein [Spongospora subterranea]
MGETAWADGPSEILHPVRHSRIGERYQATIRQSGQDDKNRKCGELVWRQRPEDVDSTEMFLNELRYRFPPQIEVDQEVALTLLHSCLHNTTAALNLADVPKCAQPPNRIIGVNPRHSGKNRRSRLEDEEHCLICKTGGTVLVCDVAGCGRLYHPDCVALARIPSGKWKCPQHLCSLCRSPNPAVSCRACWISYCHVHAPFGSDSDDYRCINCTRSYEAEKTFFLEELELFRQESLRDNIAQCKLLFQGKPVDLWALFHTVAVLGGYSKLTDDQWALVFRHLGYKAAFRGCTVTDLADIYNRHLSPFELRST